MGLRKWGEGGGSGGRGREWRKGEGRGREEGSGGSGERVESEGEGEGWRKGRVVEEGRERVERVGGVVLGGRWDDGGLMENLFNKMWRNKGVWRDERLGRWG